MPKEPVQLGLRDQINALKRKGYEAVYVPKKDKTPCEFRLGSGSGGGVNVDLKVHSQEFLISKLAVSHKFTPQIT